MRSHESETLPAETHYDRMCQQLCTCTYGTWVHTVCTYVYSVQAKRAGQLRTARWAPYSKSRTQYRVFGLGATCVFVFVFVTTSAIYKK